MTSNELKEYLKKIVRQTIKEVLMEEQGTLSHIIKETIQATQGKMVMERQEQERNILPSSIRQDRLQQKHSQLQDNKKMLTESLAKSGYDNLRGIFEGITPIASKGSMSPSPPSQGPLANIDPDDEGVSLDIFGLGNSKFKI